MDFTVQSWNRGRMMRFRRKCLICIGITSLFSGLLLYKILTPLPECYVPVSLMRRYRTPIRLHNNTCQLGAYDESINHQPKIVKTICNATLPRYVVHQATGGRTGNLLFQTASTFGIAATLGYKTYIDDSHPLLPFFEISPSTRINLTNNIVLSEEECMDSVWRCRREIYEHNITIVGYLLSWKYFSHIAPKIKKHFTVKPFYRDQAKGFMDSDLRSKNRTVVGIHVRRGDFSDLYFTACGYTMATSNYFQRAMQLYRNQFQNVLFIVISNDMKWCKANIASDDVIYSIFKDPITDLALMSMCDHMIMSGGTFGFWGSWLAGGKVIYLSDWPRAGSWLDIYGMVKEDFWPPNWIGLSNTAIRNANSIFISAVVSFIFTLFL